MHQPSAVNGTSATWTDSTGRSITIDYEFSTAGACFRPLNISGGVVVLHSSPSRDTTLRPMAVPDEEMWSGYKEASFEGGHIIGLALGGPDHEYNLVPMNKGANSGSGTWGQIESDIRRIAGLNGNAANVDLTLSYDDGVDPRIPARVTGTVSGGIHWTQINIQIKPPHDLTNILTPNLNGIFRDIKQLAVDMNIDDSNPHARLDALDRIKHNDPLIVARAQTLRNQIRQIPLLAEYPQGGIGPKQKKGKVMRVQRLLLMLHNRHMNGGLLMAEDRLNLGLMMREWQVQADHIRPYVSSKDSSYKNLRLLHHRTNNKRGAGALGAGGGQKRVRKKINRYGF